jgi:hypothetical protein
MFSRAVPYHPAPGTFSTATLKTPIMTVILHQGEVEASNPGNAVGDRAQGAKS